MRVKAGRVAGWTTSLLKIVLAVNLNFKIMGQGITARPKVTFEEIQWLRTSFMILSQRRQSSVIGLRRFRCSIELPDSSGLVRLELYRLRRS